MTTIEKWGLFELALPGKADGNPFTDYEIRGTFRNENETVTADGFYDGDGIYRVRFMPSFEGEYRYEISGSFSDEVTDGSFLAIAPTGNNHGPVRVANRYHLAYADGTPHISNGTTCYAFALQKPELVEETFRTLEQSAFNKMRFCIFPKHYDFCLYDPPEFPFEGNPMDASVLTRENFEEYNGLSRGNNWNYQRLNPRFFQIYDRVVGRLMEMGIEADLILFHAYDRWGFSKMPMADNLRYVRYMAARYGAFRNVWWALANEYELVTPSEVYWEQLADELVRHDPYHHLTSIHNCNYFYDYSKPWITHCSCQRMDLYRTTEATDEVRRKFGKPVIWDEVGYEGDLPHCWGNFMPEELVRRAWEAALRGGYCGHSETFLSEDEVIWWAHGGTLKGESAERFHFLRRFLEDVPGLGLKFWDERDNYRMKWDDFIAVPEEPQYFGQYYFFYYGMWRPSFRQIWLDNGTWFDVDIVDTWNMTITPAGRHKGRFEIPLPKRQYMGIRLRKSADQKE